MSGKRIWGTNTPIWRPDLSPEHFSEPICKVDVSLLVAWLEASGPAAPWIVQAYPEKPQRLFELPPAAGQVLETVLAHLPISTTKEVVFSRMQPGQFHDYHVDRQDNVGWLTRVHVPLVTNPLAWLKFEEEGIRLHFPVGFAYTFNAQRRHAFGNNGDSARVHLIFDVISGIRKG